ncbi:MAG: helix-turn-helix domain-containing protein [Prevotellaceae bacterium]|nr:helix-turn-helix domain-containing protein [Prevotellaceae bacterium]
MENNANIQLKLKTKEVRRSRLAKNYARDYMADQLEITQSQYSRIEKGECAVGFDKVLKIVQILDVNWLDIIDFGTEQIFYKCNQSGNNNTNTMYNQDFETERKAYLAQIEELKTQILEYKKDKEHLHEQIILLKKQNK